MNCVAASFIFLLRISFYLYACLVCFMQLRKAIKQHGLVFDSLTVVFIPFWKLRFLRMY